MRLVEPKVFYLGEFELNREGARDWLMEVGGEVAAGCLDRMTGSSVEELIELMARRCYKSFAPGLNPNVTKIREESEGYHRNILDQKHGSVTAHGHATFAFENVSRVFTHEIVRNWVGTERSQESLRYVRLTDIPIWIPAWAQADGDLLATCLKLLEHIEIHQKWMADHFGLDNPGIGFQYKKEKTSFMRRFAPIGVATGIGITFNIRSLRWIIQQRTDRGAEEEIRLIFLDVALIAQRRWPYVFQDMTIQKDGVCKFENEKI